MTSTDSFHKLLPWNFITKFHEGVVIHKDGILQRTFAYRAPDIDSSGSVDINNLALRVNDFAMRLGTGWAFHFEAQRFCLQQYPHVIFDTLAPYLIDQERKIAFNTAGKHFDSYYYLTFTYKPPSENIKKLSSMFIKSVNDDNDEISVKQNVEYFVNESNTVANLLSNNLLLVQLNNKETIEYLHSAISFNNHPINFPHTQIFLDRILPDCELDNSMPMKLGDYFIPIIGINDFPDETYPAILDNLNRARLDYRFVTRYICLDKEEGVKEARKKEKSHRGSRKSFLQTFAESTGGEQTKALNHGASVKEADSIAAGVEIENDVAYLGYLTTCVMVWDTSLKIAMKKADIVKNIINSKGFSAKYEKFNALEAFKSMMPGQIYSNYRSAPVMSYTMSHIVPLSSVWAGFRKNQHALHVTGVSAPHIVCSTVEGTPFFLNLCVGDVGHTKIFGPTGGGKSTLLNLLEMQAFKYPGSLVIVFDKGRSCRQICLASGGLFYEPSAENAAGINFQPLRDLETDRDLNDAQDFIEICIRMGGETITPPMSTEIKNSLDLMREIPFERRTITTFLQYVNYQDPKTKKPVLNDCLGDYILGGKYGRIFDSEASDLSLNTRFLALEMESLMNRGENCIVPALVYLFNFIEKKFDGRFTLLVLDEAWLFLKNEIFADKITEWLKVLRKKNVYVVFATQDVADVVNSPLKTTVIQQCLTSIYLADPSALTAGMKSVYREFGLTDTEIFLIANSTMKQDYFYTSPNGRRLFQLDLGKLTLSLIGAPDHALLDELASKFEPGSSLCSEIFNAKGINYKNFLDDYSPIDPAPVLRNYHVSNNTHDLQVIHDITTDNSSSKNTANLQIVQKYIPIHSEFLDAVKSLSEGKSGDGEGYTADKIAKHYNVSRSTVYLAKKVLKEGSQELIDELRKGEISVKTAHKRLNNQTLTLDQVV